VNPLETRRREDLARVRALCARSDGRLALVSADSEAPSELRLRARLRVALDPAYPVRAGDALALRIVIPQGYPFRDGPRTVVSPTVWHPNVFADGQVCQGRTWRVSEFLDLYLLRILRILSFQEDGVNLESVANAAAAAWYRGARARTPQAFPTDSVDALRAPGRRVGWQDADR
jgi:ubiquitin-protein ligase